MALLIIFTLAYFELLYLSLIIIITLTCFILAILYKKNIGSWFNIYTILIMVYSLGYPIRSYFLIYADNKFSLSVENILLALFISFVCLITFLIGTVIGEKYSTTSDIIILPLTNRKKLIFILFNFTLSFVPFLILIIQYGGLSNFLSLLSNRGQNFAGLSWVFSLSAIFCLSIIFIFVSKTRIKKVNFLFLLLSSMTLLLLMGSRIIFLLVLFPLLTLYDNDKTNKMKFISLFIISSIFLLFYSAYFAYFRSYVPTGSWEYFSNNYSDLLFNTIINGGLSFIDGLGVIVSKVPNEVGYLGGTSILASILMYIPSAFYPEKPPNGAELYNLKFNYNQYLTGTGQNPSFFGELYWNFGPLFLIGIMFLIGIVIGFIYKQAKKNKFQVNYLSTILLAFATPIIILHMKSGLGTASSFRITFPLFLLILQLIVLKSVRRVR